MPKNKPSANFSQAYYKCNHPNFFELNTHLNKKDYFEGPFAELEDVLYKYSNLKALQKYDQGILFFNSVEQKIKESLERFNFEGCSIGDRKNQYVNEQLEYLITSYKSVQNSKIKASRNRTFFMRTEVRTYINILLNVYRRLFWEIQKIFRLEINQQNRIFLNQNLQLEEPVRSFSLKHRVERQHYSNLYHKYLYLKFTPTDFEKFRVLFEDKVVANKINWIGTKGSLVYLIKQLIERNLIDNPKNKHWKMVSESILFKGEPILSKELVNQPPPKKDDQIRIDHFLNGLTPQN